MRSTVDEPMSAPTVAPRPARARRGSTEDQAAVASAPSAGVATEPAATPAAHAVPVATVRMLRVEEGLYALRIGEIAGPTAEIGGMAMPAVQVAAPFAEEGGGVEIIASFPRQGSWIGREGGTLVLRSPREGGYVIATAYGGPPGDAGGAGIELSLDLRRLDGPGAEGISFGHTEAPGGPLTGTRDIPAEILLHIERAGDRLFPGRGWVGALGRRMRIEAFSIRPLETLAPSDIEMKGFLPNGAETPWVPGGSLCGTRGRGLPLIGFALRIVPQRADRFEVSYQGSFFAGGISETHRNGDPCRAAAANDPLEAVNVRLIERIPEPVHETSG